MERRQFAVRGIVQGVGFRPFVHGLASRLALSGFVRNTSGGVLIQVEGAADALTCFERELLTAPPPLASIQECRATSLSAIGDVTFRIEASDLAGSDASDVTPSPDAGTCDACLRELFDPANRRYRYPFVTCATCGPRLTIIRGVPYDRERTTMGAFAMCESCRREYEDPADRRFHAETIACPACGPAVRVLEPDGSEVHGDAFAHLGLALLHGRIAAVKGLGGYHLACDATNAVAVAELRSRKHRDEKPFAVMFDAIGSVEQVCAIDEEERRVLAGPTRPVVLLRRHSRCAARHLAPAEAVAPGLLHLGAMLPSTPLHHLLVAAAGRPLVMTSGNRSQEPIVTRDEEVLIRLNGIADLFLVHDRPIHVRCDDGVTRVVDGSELPVRRSRGDAPRPIRLPAPCPQPILAVGGHLKNTFALGRGNDAFISHHIGDLDDYEACQAFRRDVDLYENLLRVTPSVVAHDLHPDYESTRYAVSRAAVGGLRLEPVQHHHAHVASCMAEHGLMGPVIGVALDGSGFGLDGTIWGGEFLVGDARHVRRAAHLRPVALPGGERAVHEPWRMAVAHLLDSQCSAGAIAERHPRAFQLIGRMIERRVNTPFTSSAGRLFDAVAAIAGIADAMTFEGQAAMMLEAAAEQASGEGAYPIDLQDADDGLELDTRPLIAAAASDARAGCSAGTIAGRFHAGLAAAVAHTCLRLRAMRAPDTVVLTGGVFLNARLTRECMRRLSSAGFRVFRHHRVPPNDGGLSLGQLAVAAARAERREVTCQIA